MTITSSPAFAENEILLRPDDDVFYKYIINKNLHNDFTLILDILPTLTILAQH